MPKDQRELVLTELDLAILVFHGQLYKIPTEREVADSRERLRFMGLLYDRDVDIETEDQMPLTDRGIIHLDHLLSRPLPQRRGIWVHDED